MCVCMYEYHMHAEKIYHKYIFSVYLKRTSKTKYQGVTRVYMGSSLRKRKPDLTCVFL